MKNQQANLALTILILLISVKSLAQPQLIPFAEVGIPNGEFKKESTEPGVGYGLGFTYPVHKSNIGHIGLDINYELLGKSIAADPVNDMRVVINNNVFMMHAFFRLKPIPNSPVSPYIDLLGGFKSFNTRIKWREDILSQAEDSSTEFEDASWGHGMGWGIQIKLSKWAHLDLSGRLLKSGEVKYVDKTGVSDDGEGNIFFEETRSRTDMLVFRIGIAARVGDES